MSISGDGRYVAFDTTAPLVAGDTNGKRESFEMFEDMMKRFQEETVRILYLMQILERPEHPYTQSLIAAVPRLVTAQAPLREDAPVVLEARAVTKTFRQRSGFLGRRQEVAAVKSVSLDLRRGEQAGRQAESAVRIHDQGPLDHVLGLLLAHADPEGEPPETTKLIASTRIAYGAVTSAISPPAMTYSTSL